MKRETIEEFLARGGEVERFPYQPPGETKEMIRSSSPSPMLYDLGYGELFYGSKNKTKKKKPISKKLENMDLPQDVLQRLKEKLHD
jgi:hypothetical protein